MGGERDAVILLSDTHGVIDSIGPGLLVVSPMRRMEPTMAEEKAVPEPVTVLELRPTVPCRSAASCPE
jgi:hypothetical protein